jgi:hypothetical protein
MADVKISGLPGSTVPLAGTEVLPIVQGGATKQVSIANVTAGRAIAATSITTDTYKAASSSGGVLQNSGGTAQLQWGSGGGNNLSVDVAININPANAAVAISPTGTGTVTINPATASTMNNVAIGGTTPLAGRFTAATANSFTPDGAAVPTNGLYLPATNSIGLSTNSTNAVYIDSSQNVMIGTTTAFAAGGTSFDRSNNSNFVRIVQNSLVDGPTCQSFQVNSVQNGYIAVSAGLTIYATTSDYRTKENVAKMTGALDKVALLNPVTFNWVDSKKSCQGFIAHELQSVIPECVFGEKDAVDKEGKPVLQGVDTSFLVATLTAAIQELKAEFDAYKATHP